MSTPAEKAAAARTEAAAELAAAVAALNEANDVQEAAVATRDAAVVQARATGLSIKEVAEASGLSEQGVYAAQRRHAKRVAEAAAGEREASGEPGVR